MAGFNSVVLVGRLVADPEIRTTTTGKNIATFTLAVDKFKDGANFIDCETWERTADYVKQYTKKGNQVLVSGTLEQNVWEKDGKKQSKLFVSVRSLQSLSSATPRQEKAEPTEDTAPISYDEIPF